MSQSHMRSALDRALANVRDDTLRLGSLVETAIQRSVQSLKDKDLDLAQQIIREDQYVNELRFRIEEECITCIATQQPAAGYLRTLVAAMHIAGELERMGDHAAGIAKIVLRIADEPLLKPLIDVPRMADLVTQMLRAGLEAFVARDAEAARKAAQGDDSIDHLYNQVFRELLTYMLEDPKTITRATYLLWVAHNLERIGDRVTNISERVIFMTTGTMQELNF